MAKGFGAQLRAIAEKNKQKIEDVDRAFKFGLFGMVVRNTRVADPGSWKRPDPNYRGGQMRGNWFVGDGAPVDRFIEGLRNTSTALHSAEATKIKPFTVTYLTNTTPYVRVYEEKDAMIGLAIADARRQLEKVAREAST